MSRANSLAFYELLGDASLINQELSKYNAVTVEDIQHYSHEIFDADNSNVLYYYSNN
jgi:predicted Zn-dependent peptidase